MNFIYLIYYFTIKISISCVENNDFIIKLVVNYFIDKKNFTSYEEDKSKVGD